MSSASVIYTGFLDSPYGNWPSGGLFGSDGFVIPGDSGVIPSYVTYTNTGIPTIISNPASGTDYGYDGFLVTAEDHTARINSNFYAPSGSISFDVNFNFSGITPHLVSLYIQDESESTYETLTITDVSTGFTLYSDSIFSSFASEGTYYQFFSTGHVNFNFTPLFGERTSLRGIFFDEGITVTSDMNLYLEATGNEIDSIINLYLNGIPSGHSLSYNTLPLYLNGTALTSYLNLFLRGYDQGFISEEMNLYLEATGNNINDSIECILLGTSLDLYDLTLDQLNNLILDELNQMMLGPNPIGWPFFNNVNLYINGSGQNNGFIPINSNLNLFLSAPNGVNKELPLYINGQMTSEIPLYLHGVSGIKNGFTNLYLHAVNIADNYLPLFARGYNIDDL